MPARPGVRNVSSNSSPVAESRQPSPLTLPVAAEEAYGAAGSRCVWGAQTDTTAPAAAAVRSTSRTDPPPDRRADQQLPGREGGSSLRKTETMGGTGHRRTHATKRDCWCAGTKGRRAGRPRSLPPPPATPAPKHPVYPSAPTENKEATGPPRQQDQRSQANAQATPTLGHWTQGIGTR